MPVLPYPLYKLAMVGLLTVNVLIFARLGTPTNTLDAFAWLVLLVVYEVQNHMVLSVDFLRRLQRLRNVLIVVIMSVFLRYLQESEWLEVTNDILWFALIVLLETEVRWPDKVRQFRNSYWLATLTIFSGLIGMVLVWAWQSAWLDVYDACLWILAFASIEADILHILQRKPA